MSTDFDRAIPFTLHEEGTPPPPGFGNVDDPDDPGGRTSRGVTQRNWDKFCAAMKWPQSDVWAAPQARIILFYRLWVWPKAAGDALGWPLNLAAFDTGVLHGTARARQWLALTHNVDAFIAEREHSYAAIVQKRPTSQKYLKDWMGRCRRLRLACGLTVSSP